MKFVKVLKNDKTIIAYHGFIDLKIYIDLGLRPRSIYIFIGLLIHVLTSMEGYIKNVVLVLKLFSLKF
jgi:hypothetical protein